MSGIVFVPDSVLFALFSIGLLLITALVYLHFHLNILEAIADNLEEKRGIRRISKRKV